MPRLQTPHEKILEALLFVSGDSVPVAQLAGAIGCDIPTVRTLLEQMTERYAEEEAGIQLLALDESYQFCANPAYNEHVQRLRQAPPRKALTAPLLETLSIIAYKQPVTKGVIEDIRGVNADHAVNKLLEYGLIVEMGRLDAPGKPILFGTSEAFLRYFGLRSVEAFRLETQSIKDE